MKIVLAILVIMSVFVAGCAAQEKSALEKKAEPVTIDVQQAADELNKQIDSLSAGMKSAAEVLKKEMPEILKKIQGLIAELEQAAKEVQESIDTNEPAAEKE